MQNSEDLCLKLRRERDDLILRFQDVLLSTENAIEFKRKSEALHGQIKEKAKQIRDLQSGDGSDGVGLGVGARSCRGQPSNLHVFV